MNFEWMKDINLLAYVMGSTLGLTFILGVFMGSKKLEASQIEHEIYSRYGKIYKYVFQVILAMIAIVAVKMIYSGGAANVKTWLGLSYWLSMVFIIFYILTRRVAVTKEGIGYIDMFNRTSNLFYPWKQLKVFELSDTSIKVMPKSQGKGIQMKIKLDSEALIAIRTIAKKAMK